MPGLNQISVISNLTHLHYKININLCALFTGFLCLCSSLVLAQQSGNSLDLWSEGYLDIHHINTGSGDAAFFILPDGTTMLFDVGAHNRPPGGAREMFPKPNDTRSPGEWISRYIKYMLQEWEEIKLDYVLLSHFHSDHMGGVYEGMPVSETESYGLSGVTDVGDRIPIHRIIDRAWPDYNWPVPLGNESMKNYRQFLSWHVANQNLEVKQFKVGVNDQIVLVNKPEKYPGFEVRNIAANGKAWTGTADNVRNHFPDLKTLDAQDLPTENMCSLAIRLSYGKFDYFTGGDLVGVPPPGSPHWHDIETPIGKSVGPVEVNVTNHHAHFDAQNENFIRSLRPKVHIIQSWVVNHPAPSTLRRLLSTNLYPGPRDIFSTNLPEVTKTFIGSEADKINNQQGHIVVRVKPGGETYYVFVLNDSDESFRIKSVNGPYQAN